MRDGRAWISSDKEFSASEHLIAASLGIPAAIPTFP